MTYSFRSTKPKMKLNQKIKGRSLNAIVKIFAISLLPISCNADRGKTTASSAGKDYVITGQAFVIQKNRVNVKLGGVEVKYIDGPTFDVRLKWISQNLNKAVALESYIQDLRELERLADDNRIRYSDFVQREFFNSIDRFVELQMNRILAEPALVELIDVQSGIKSFNAETWMASAIFGDWQNTQNFLTTTTNADGEFSMEIPSGSRGFLIAESSRHLMGDQIEEYEWLYELAESITTPVHLNTMNTFDMEQLMNLADVFRNQQPYSVELLCEDYRLDRISWAAEVENFLVKANAHKQKISTNKERIEKLRSEIQAIKEMSWIE